MTFEEILDHAIAMLKRRRRVAYRTLQVQFNLDENALEALKDELLYAQQVARDEDGRVLLLDGRRGRDGSVANVNFGAKIRQSRISNSMPYRLPNARKSKCATEPRHPARKREGTPQVPNIPQDRRRCVSVWTR